MAKPIFNLNYTKNFKCIKGDCNHSCCEHWIIDIDGRTLKKYQELAKTNHNFTQNVDYLNGCFIPTKNRRCPFLNKQNLCDIIINHGDSYLCTTCKLHPRFRNFFSTFTEEGVGLCCEEGARLLLTQKARLKLIKHTKSKPNDARQLSKCERQILRFRAKVLKIAQDRSHCVLERAKLLLEFAKANFKLKSVAEFIKIFNHLEILENNSSKIYNKILLDQSSTLDFDEFLSQKQPDFNKNSKLSIAFEQVLCYFIFRHLSNATDTTDLLVLLAFCVLSFYMVLVIFCYQPHDLYGLIEACRVYSSEIEYSDENLNKILCVCEQSLNLLL